MIDLKKIIDGVASIPDHLWAMAVIGAGSVLTVAHQHDTGQALIAAGLAMWKGKQ